MEVGCQRHAPAAFTPGKDPVPIVREAEWATGPVWIDAENLVPSGIRSPDLPARRVVAIPTELSRLLLLVKNEQKIRGQYCCLQLHGLRCPSGPYTLKKEAVTSFETLDNSLPTDAVSYTRGLESYCFWREEYLT